MPHTNQPMPHFWKVLTQPGLRPETFYFCSRCSNHWATGLGWLTNVKSEMAWWLSPLWLTTASQSLLTGNTQLYQDMHGKHGWINQSSYRFLVSFKEHHQHWTGRMRQDVLPGIYFTAEWDRVIPSFDTVHCPRMPHATQLISFFWKVLTQPRLEPGTFHFRGGCSNHWAAGLGWLTNVKSEMAWWL